MTQTQQKIKEILTQQTTGTRIVWGKPGWMVFKENGVEFDQDILIDEYCATIPIATWMDNVFEYCPGLSDKIDGIINATTMKDVDDVLDYFDRTPDEGVFIVGSDGPAYYTYNTDQVSLERDIQVSLVRLEIQDGIAPDGWYAALQVHNGLDARSGLSSQVIFRIKDDVVEHTMEYCGEITIGVFLHATAHLDISCGEDGDLSYQDIEWNEDLGIWMKDGQEVSFYNSIINGF